MPRKGTYVPKSLTAGCKATVFINQNKSQLTLYPQVRGSGAEPTRLRMQKEADLLLLEEGWERETEWRRLPSDVKVAVAVKL